VRSWASLAYDARRASTLYALANSTTANQKDLYYSRDGGITLGNLLMAIPGKTGAIALDSARQMLLLLYEDASGGTIKYRQSFDGGATWSAAANITYSGGSLTASVLSLVQDARATGAFFLQAKDAGGSTKIYQSRDLGVNWTLLLS
jgi:hypothetical protein